MAFIPHLISLILFLTCERLTFLLTENHEFLMPKMNVQLVKQCLAYLLFRLNFSLNQFSHTQGVHRVIGQIEKLIKITMQTGYCWNVYII